MKLRHRFLKVVKRDFFRDQASYNQQRVTEGNAAAHHGDCISDSSLFIFGARTDESTMFKVYGLGPRQIHALRISLNSSLMYTS